MEVVLQGLLVQVEGQELREQLVAQVLLVPLEPLDHLDRSGLQGQVVLWVQAVL